MNVWCLPMLPMFYDSYIRNLSATDFIFKVSESLCVILWVNYLALHLGEGVYKEAFAISFILFYFLFHSV